MNFPLMPPQASEHAVAYDALFWTITALTVIFTLIVGVMIYGFAVKYKRGSSADRRNAQSHNEKLEVLLLVVPTVLGLAIFAWSAVNFTSVRTPKKDEMELFVIGKRWMWHVQHMNGIRENNEMHVPVGQPIRLTMISQDVIHAMYLPAFRAQYHVVPGRYTSLHFTPTKPGTYKLLCGIHCGTQHSEMVGFVHVLSQQDFDEWLESGGNRYTKADRSMEQVGADLWKEKGCGNCHQGTDNNRAPSLNGIFNTQRTMTDGSTVLANEDYLRESILRPWDRISAGYENTMQAYANSLSEEQVLSLIAYIKSTGSGATPGQGEYEQPVRDGRALDSSSKSTIDIANDRASAGASQAKELTN
ncbi:MAG: cytochrome c oxidase subunit II [Fimbriimonadaceae bacterium]|nr:cytochrome c oxidase subunit II [Fimbriimonadaceae bacterium]